MTDTQEAMREPAVKQFETLYGLGAWVDMDNEREAFLSGINYAAAQSAEKIAALEKLRLATQLKLIAAEEKIARLEAAVLNQMIFRAAAELSNKQLRDAGNKLDGAAEEYEGDDGIYMGIELDDWHEFTEALAHPTSTEALDAYVAKETEELREFAIWLTGCGYDFTKHQYFMDNRHLLHRSFPPAPDKDKE